MGFNSAFKGLMSATKFHTHTRLRNTTNTTKLKSEWTGSRPTFKPETSGTRLEYYDHYTTRISSIHITDASVFGSSKKGLSLCRLSCGFRPIHDWH